MKKINLLVLLFILTIGLLSGFNWNFSNNNIIFYGFAHNKELNINLENSAQVKNIFITPGQIVKKGDVLIEVIRSSIAVTQSDITHDISKLHSQHQIWELGLKNSLRTIVAQKTARKNELQSAINKLESEMKINEKLIKDIESIDQIKDHNGNNPREIELTGLRSDLKLTMNTFNTEIRKIEKELYNPENPIKIQIEKLGNNLEFVNEEEKKLDITAPNDGVVGSILCKVGENIPAFSPYLTLYEKSPNHVKGYVIENLIPNINKHDTLVIKSVSHPHIFIHGVVTGMGSRIIEIPTRLRKNPAFPVYGREIEISIASDNPFLQNEKVILKPYNKSNTIPLFELASSKK